jgi:signal transduction histidine kinase
MFKFVLDLDKALPLVNVNEFVVWEILEPIIQNSIDHGNKRRINILISTKYDLATNISVITISDDGVGIVDDLLTVMPNGIKKLFLENETTKLNEGVNSGYGCFIAHQMAVGKCGWGLEAENIEPAGCKFTITIKN